MRWAIFLVMAALLAASVAARCAPDPLSVPCGASVPALCDGRDATVQGLRCDALSVCSGSSCVERRVIVEPSAKAIAITARDMLALNFSLTPRVDAKLRVLGWPSAPIVGGRLGYVSTIADVGTHTVTVVAEDPTGGGVLGDARVSVLVRCDPSHEGCCIAGTDAYQSPGSVCEAIVGKASSGRCSPLGECVPSCEAHSALRCNGDTIYSYDSCGTREALVQACDARDVCLESGGIAHCAHGSPYCEGAFAYECDRGEGRRIDTSCNRSQIVLTCPAGQSCVIRPSGLACEAKGPCEQGQALCGGACVDAQASRTDCGACGKRCAKDQACVRGECAQLPGCAVVCDRDPDCGRSETCVNPGDCAMSQCRRSRPLENDAQLAGELAASAVQVRTALEGNAFVFTLVNLAPMPAHNVSLEVDFTRQVAEYAGELEARGVAAEPVGDGPVLRLLPGALSTERSFSVAVRDRASLDPGYLSYPRVGSPRYDRLDAQQFIAAAQRAHSAIAIGVATSHEGGSTRVRLLLAPSKTLSGLTVAVSVPRCMIVRGTQGAPYAIKDSLLAWRFASLSQDTEVGLLVDGAPSEACLNELRATAFAERVGKPVSPWLALLAIPVIGAVIIIFQRSMPREQLSFKEFRRLARRQGMSEEDIESDWLDYKRRFQ